MKPSSLSTSATAALRRLAGMSTAGRSMKLALRMRVSMSATVSVIMVVGPSPARLGDAGDQPVAGHVAEADAADAELAVHRPRPPAQFAAQPDADDVARPHGPHLLVAAARRFQARHLLLILDVLRLGRHECLAGLSPLSPRGRGAGGEGAAFSPSPPPLPPPGGGDAF